MDPDEDAYEKDDPKSAAYLDRLLDRDDDA